MIYYICVVGTSITLSVSYRKLKHCLSSVMSAVNVYAIVHFSVHLSWFCLGVVIILTWCFPPGAQERVSANVSLLWFSGLIWKDSTLIMSLLRLQAALHSVLCSRVQLRLRAAYEVLNREGTRTNPTVTQDIAFAMDVLSSTHDHVVETSL